MIKRAHIRQFLAVVDSGSFTSAAARIHITQPTLSAGIAELERQVGTALFVRDRRHVRLTDAGGRFLVMARRIDREFRELDDFSRSTPSEWPDLRLGLIPTLSPALFETLIGAFSAQYRLELVEAADAELRGMIATGRINLAVTLLRNGEGNDSAIPLLSEPYRMFVPANHPLAGRGMAQAEELASEIMIARRNCEILGETSRFFTARGVRPRFAYRGEIDARCMALVAAGQGLTTAPLSLQVSGTMPIAVQGYDFNRTLGLVGEPGWQSRRDMRETLAGLCGQIAA